MSARFAEKVVLITGAAQGIGRRVAERAAAEGAHLALIDRSELIHELPAALAPAEVLALTADLSGYEQTQAAVDAVMQRFARIDVLINNVGGTIWAKPFEHYAADEIQAEIARSLYPTLWTCRAVLPHMLAREQGCIVNVSSIATRSINRLPYAAAKGGVNALTASLAFETAGRGLRVNAVAPGGTEAPPRRIPRHDSPPSPQENLWYQQIVEQTRQSSLMHRYGSLDEQAAAILFLASDEASYITGTVLPVGGGDQG